jgi:O-6-methylguanine DNA methyltransferase
MIQNKNRRQSLRFATSVALRRGSCPIFTKTIRSPIKPLRIAAVDEGICMLQFVDDTSDLSDLTAMSERLDRSISKADHPLLDELTSQLTEYFAGTRTGFDLPVALAGTEFQCAVWKQLARIPYGETASYEDIARRTGHPDAQRAVGSANGRNSVAIVIPCHRVVRKDGGLGGFGGGLWRKKFLLALEGDVPAPSRRKRTSRKSMAIA